jgi:hypothetical protein
MSLAYVKCAIGGYFFDATISENHDFENQITVNPVQTGANVNDHVFAQPILYTMQIFQSDCLASIVRGQFDVSGLTRSQTAVAMLMGLWQKAQILTIQTSLQTYQSMIIKSCIITKDNTTMSAIKATVILQQLIITDAQAVSISTIPAAPAPATSIFAQVAQSKSKGKVSVLTPSSPAFAPINSGVLSQFNSGEKFW